MAEERVQRRLAAILAADVVGYSRMIEADEEGTRARLRHLQSEMIDPQIDSDGGRIVKTMGDGILVEFPSAVDAVRNALAIQSAMANHNSNLPEDQRLVFRVGINLGDVIIEGDDIHGDGVNVASRLEGLCEPGGVYISATVHDHVEGKLTASFDDLGERTVKNISRPVQIYRVNSDKKATTNSAKITSRHLQSDRPSVACLPFKNLGDDQSQDFPADAIRLGIQASLVLIPGMLVIAPPVMNKYRDQDVSAAQVAKDMGVRYVLEGACQQSKDRIRITAQLTDTTTGQVVWADRYDRDISDTLKTQDEITVQIVTALDINYLSGSPTSLRNTLTNLDALHAFYRGLNFFYSRSKDDSSAAKKEFEHVYRLDSGSPVGPAYLSMIHLRDVMFGWAISRNKSLMEAVKWAEKAVQFEETDGLAHIVLASIHLINRRYDEALSTCRKALEIRPNCPMANSSLANVLHYCGESDEAVELIREAILISPSHPSWYEVILAAAYLELGELQNSISAAKKGTEINPKDIDARLMLCSGYNFAGLSQEARTTAREVIKVNPSFSLENYAETQPYRDEATLKRLIGSLREAGLPE
jgi:class 3 adenylate cyclase/tetratricopeptide (TPR) repeat protein